MEIKVVKHGRHGSIIIKPKDKKLIIGKSNVEEYLEKIFEYLSQYNFFEVLCNNKDKRCIVFIKLNGEQYIGFNFSYLRLIEYKKFTDFICNFKKTGNKEIDKKNLYQSANKIILEIMKADTDFLNNIRFSIEDL